MIDLFARYIIPAAYAILPPRMNSPNATAMILAICGQESNFVSRRQGNSGPARGFAQFEKAGIRGVAQHPSSRDHLKFALAALQYSASVGQTAQLHAIVEHNDVLAAVFARLLLYTLPDRLPSRDDPRGGWAQYIAAWRPGKPHPETWDHHFTVAWSLVDAETKGVTL